MFSAASVCLSVCLFVCLHDNFRTIKRRMMKLGRYVHCTKILVEFEFGDQRLKVKVTRDKNAFSVADTPGAYEWYALAANSLQQQRTGLFRGCQGVFSGACVRCVFGESSLALVSKYVMQLCRPPVLRRWENQRMLSSCLSVCLSFCLSTP